MSKVDVIMSVRSIDKKPQGASMGSKIHNTEKNVTDTVQYHEVWGLNKHGKVDQMKQYTLHN